MSLHLWNCYDVPYCLKCGEPSPRAQAIKDGHFNPELYREWVLEFPDVPAPEYIGWCCEQHYREFQAANTCEVSDDEWEQEQKERRERGARTIPCSERAARRMLLQA